MKTAILKFNNGEGAILCSKCKVIIKVGSEMNDEEKQAMRGEIKIPAQYCTECQANYGYVDQSNPQ